MPTGMHASGIPTVEVILLSYMRVVSLVKVAIKLQADSMGWVPVLLMPYLSG